jgi:2-polyprenyl-3-methyl-5-hydroxy-6-metoxy-1,4-benzoquinol methylase
VIEHVPNAHSFMHHLARLTKTSGYVFLTTPDAGHWRVPKNFVQWPEVKPPEHVAWFTKNSLRHLLEAHGFEVVHFAWNLKPGLRVLARKNP